MPWIEWRDLAPRIDSMWDPENTPHHSVIGLTGAGKSFLVVNGLLSMCNDDRVLIIDTKGDDPLISRTGKAVKTLPRTTWKARNRKPREHWYRLQVSDSREEARKQVMVSLQRAYDEGEWVIVFDEIRDITDPRSPGLGLLPWVDRIYRKGRSRHVSIIASTQAPRWVPSSFYDQASFAWIGRLRDEQRQKRLLEIGGLAKSELPVIAQLRRRQWLLAADNGEFFARTMVKV